MCIRRSPSPHILATIISFHLQISSYMSGPLVRLLQNYVQRMVANAGIPCLKYSLAYKFRTFPRTFQFDTDATGSGAMKALLLDAETSGMVSLVCPLSQLLEMNIFLVDRIESSRESLAEMQAVCILRPINVIDLDIRFIECSPFH